MPLYRVEAIVLGSRPFGEADRLVMETMQYAVPVRQAGGKDVDDIRDGIWDCIVLKAATVEQCVREGAAKENALRRTR